MHLKSKKHIKSSENIKYLIVFYLYINCLALKKLCTILYYLNILDQPVKQRLTFNNNKFSVMPFLPTPLQPTP